MGFNSIEFIAFTLGVILVFFIFPRKLRYLWLLAASIFFYALWGIPYAILLLVSAVLTFFLGILCEKNAGECTENPKAPRCAKKKYLILGIAALAAELVVFKYLDFILSQLNVVNAAFHIKLRFRGLGLLLPVGISFYVFQSIGYLVDVYRGKTRAERDIIRFLLFITFFPKIVQGPIERADGFLQQIRDLEQRSRFNYQRVTNGLITALWGLFMKMVIADRIGIVVDQVFSTYFVYGTVELVFGAVCYAIQIYCDFAGYSAIAVGVARVFGLDLIQNFDCPYFSMSTSEFWRRWHISLSTWFRDYVYIPLGGSRCSKWRKRLNVLITMLVSGIWHGAGWNFVFWGLIHGAYQATGDLCAAKLSGFRERMHVRTRSKSYRVGKMLVTFVLIDFAWIFFRAQNLAIAVDYLRRLFCNYNPWALFDGSLLRLGLDQIEMNVLCLSMALLIVVDVVQYRRRIRIDQMLENQCLWFRWGVIILLFTLVWVCGEYGPFFSSSDFIYQSF